MSNVLGYISRADRQADAPCHTTSRGKVNNGILKKSFRNSDWILFHTGAWLTGQHVVQSLTGVVTCCGNSPRWFTTRRHEPAAPAGGAAAAPQPYMVTPARPLSSVSEALARADMAAIEELSPSAGPLSPRPPEDEIDDDEDEDVGARPVCRSVHATCRCLGPLLRLQGCSHAG